MLLYDLTPNNQEHLIPWLGTLNFLFSTEFPNEASDVAETQILPPYCRVCYVHVHNSLFLWILG